MSLFITITDGPCEGFFPVRGDRPPILLRGVIDNAGKKDVLDQIGDIPREGEQVHLHKLLRWEHRLNREEPEKSGWYATYAYMPRLHVTAFTDGGNVKNSAAGPGAASAVLVDDDGAILFEDARTLPNVTNNQAEYQGIILAIALARMAEVTHISFVTDSQLVANQIQSYWAIKDAELAKLHSQVEIALLRFAGWSIRSVPRSQNKRADWHCQRLTGKTKVAKTAPEVVLP